MPPNQQRQSTEGNDSIRELDIFARSNSAQLLLHGCSAADVSLAFAALSSLRRPVYESSFWASTELYETSRNLSRAPRQLFGGAAGRLPAGRASEYVGERAFA